MSTTTIRLSKELKDKVVRAAERAGKTPHGFILEAIAEKAELEDRRATFIETAKQRYAGIAASGRRWRGPRCANIWNSGFPGAAPTVPSRAVSRDRRGSH